MKREQIDKAHAEDLYAAILQLQTAEEVESFFFDLCTPAELEGLVDRWRVAQMLVKCRIARSRQKRMSYGDHCRSYGWNNGNDGHAPSCAGLVKSKIEGHWP